MGMRKGGCSVNEIPLSEEEKAQVARHAAASHAMQSGVQYEQSSGSQDGTPKHLRVGVNVALSDHGALVELLIVKGVITRLEYLTAIANAMEVEVVRYEQRLSERYGGAVVKLA